MASAVMAGAVFFHLATPLGINVLGDGGLLFGMAVSVLVLGIVLFIINRGGEVVPGREDYRQQNELRT